MSQIELLSTRLLKNRLLVIYLKIFSIFLNRPQGWHYYLDQIKIIKTLSLCKNRTNLKIMDAGAGLGITQFVLSSLGFKIYSLDFSNRKFPKYYHWFFDLEYIDNNSFNYTHTYQAYIKYHNNILDKFKNGLSIYKLFNWIILKFLFLFSIPFFILIKLIKPKFGKIYIIRAPFHEIPFNNNYFDYIVSVSAIEHSDKDILRNGIEEFRRVLKSKGKLLITTSLNVDVNEMTFHNNTEGWCFSIEFLENAFNITNFKKINFSDVIAYQNEFLNNKIWKFTLPFYYKKNNFTFFKDDKDRYYLPYLPVIIIDEKY